VRLAGEPLPGRLPGYAEGNGDLVPRSATCSRNLDGFPEPGLVGAYCLGHRSDLPEVVGVVNLRGRWIESVGQPLEPAGGLLDVIVCVSPGDHLLIPGTGRTSIAAPSSG